MQTMAAPKLLCDWVVEKMPQKVSKAMASRKDGHSLHLLNLSGTDPASMDSTGS